MATIASSPKKATDKKKQLKLPQIPVTLPSQERHWILF